MAEDVLLILHVNEQVTDRGGTSYKLGLISGGTVSPSH